MSGDEGAASIARIVAHSPHMHDFKMVSSRVGPEGGTALADALAATGMWNLAKKPTMLLLLLLLSL